ncbi:hypothetical protein CROQUDRAFT_313774 [Cronartium quercuum f. sp. fusiforme G11]|uniref:Uncharacterized protein n=1 Tax=Cronartium quercuum f. sp. fusiforme G11 TaxID=708437 RepID=A0A9P6NXV8_9BASI|nr:hypothetical protein CROQUDRAFT_313774 [Cronartium quercuum f. sp. fusiforme G11]
MSLCAGCHAQIVILFSFAVFLLPILSSGLRRVSAIQRMLVPPFFLSQPFYLVSKLSTSTGASSSSSLHVPRSLRGPLCAV